MLRILMVLMVLFTGSARAQMMIYEGKEFLEFLKVAEPVRFSLHDGNSEIELIGPPSGLRAYDFSCEYVKCGIYARTDKWLTVPPTRIEYQDELFAVQLENPKGLTAQELWESRPDLTHLTRNGSRFTPAFLYRADGTWAFDQKGGERFLRTKYWQGGFGEVRFQSDFTLTTKEGRIPVYDWAALLR